MHGLTEPTGSGSLQANALALSESQQQDTTSSNSQSGRNVSDSDLIQLIAQKRQEMGETMTETDKKTMKEHMDRLQKEGAETVESQEELEAEAEAQDEPAMQYEGEALSYEDGADAESEDVFAQMEKSMPESKKSGGGSLEAESSRQVEETQDRQVPNEQRQKKADEQPASVTIEPDSLPASGGKKE